MPVVGQSLVVKARHCYVVQLQQPGGFADASDLGLAGPEDRNLQLPLSSTTHD